MSLTPMTTLGHMDVHIKSHLSTVPQDDKLSEILRCVASNGVHHTSRARLSGDNVSTKFTCNCRQSAAHRTTGTVLLRLLNTQNSQRTNI